MNTLAKAPRATIIPCLTYRHPRQAIDWLCSTFGFQRHSLHADEHGNVVHAELAFGHGMVMLGSADRDTPYGRLLTLPGEIWGRQTQTVYVVTDDVDEIHRRAQATGVELVMPLEDHSYGGRGFSCRDLEGHVWSFGSYDPAQTSQSHYVGALSPTQ